MAKFNAMHPDLVLLDVQLPGLNGLEIAGKIRQNHGTPIIMLTARTDTEDIVKGLEAGADDYVPKPFDSAVLIARINARLRDTKPAGAEVITLGPITIDVPGHEVRKDGIRLQLTPLEFNLLQTLAASPGEVFSREELLVKVWGYQFKPDDKFKPDTRLVNVHVQRLRSKIEEDADSPHFVLTERGIGYKAGSN
jgi:two-component system response regulator MtrA